MRQLTLTWLLVLALALVACGDKSTPAAAGDAAAGEKLFQETATPACATCHSLEPGVTLVGPSLATIGAEAGSSVSGMSAEAYLRQSIVEPGANIVEGFNNVMPATYATGLSAQQVDDLVAYMLTLK
jgi:nitric oxide reductase subunit C